MQLEYLTLPKKKKKTWIPNNLKGFHFGTIYQKTQQDTTSMGP